MKRLILAVSMLALSLSGVRAVALTIEITKGADGGIPIAVVPFKWQGQTVLPADIGDIIAADLYRSGQFNPLPVMISTEGLDPMERLLEGFAHRRRRRVNK